MTYMNIKQWWNDIYEGKQEYSQDNLTQVLNFSIEISELYKER
jgi:hypothetical protein